MTEEEAKKRWCPMRRLMEVGGVKINNTEPGTFTLSCIGSDCMMWRWEHPPERVRALEVATGYCGLAGKL